jgi:hypothetical protein
MGLHGLQSYAFLIRRESVPEEFKVGDIVEAIDNPENRKYAAAWWNGEMGPFRVTHIGSTLALERLDGVHRTGGKPKRFKKVGINSKEDMEALYG